jgi:hypothetical protein
MKFALLAGLTVAAAALAGCQHAMTLEEAEAACTAQGGLLAVIYTEKITRTSVGPVVASPGECISPDKFNKGAVLPTLPPRPAAAKPPADAAPAPAPKTD